MLAKIMKHISSLRHATMFKIIATAAILIPLPIIAFVMHRGGFAQQLRELSASLEVTRAGDSSVEIKLQELCTGLDWVKRELIKVPSQKNQHDKSQFSWNGLLFDASLRLFCDCLEQPDADKHQSLIKKILVQVDAISDEFTDSSDLFFDADLGYLAQAWQVKMHQALHANVKNRLEALFNRSANKKAISDRPVKVVVKEVTRTSEATAPRSYSTAASNSGISTDQQSANYSPSNQDYRGDTDEPDFGEGQRNVYPVKKIDESEVDDSSESGRPVHSKSSHDSSDFMDEMRSFFGDDGKSGNFDDMCVGKDADWANRMRFSLDDMRERQRKYEIIRDNAMENHKKQSFQNIKNNAIALLGG